jgi:hypothetical protein
MVIRMSCGSDAAAASGDGGPQVGQVAGVPSATRLMCWPKSGCHRSKTAEPTLPGRVRREQCTLIAGWQSGMGRVLIEVLTEPLVRCGRHASQQWPQQASLCCAACMLQLQAACQCPDAQQLYWCHPDTVQRIIEGLNVSSDVCQWVLP